MTIEIDVARIRRKTFAVLGDAGIGDEDRRDLATFVLGRRVKSYKDLTPEEWQRVGDAVTGWFAIEHLRRERGSA